MSQATYRRDILDVINKHDEELREAKLRSGSIHGVSGIGHTHPMDDIIGLQASLDGKQPLDAQLTALSGLNPPLLANNLPYFVGPGPADVGLTPLSPFAMTVLDDADAGAMRSTIGALGSADISGKQDKDNQLDAIAALAPSGLGAQLPYFTSSLANGASLANVSLFILGLLDDADAAAARTTLGVTPANIGALPNPLPANGWITSTGGDNRFYLVGSGTTVVNGIGTVEFQVGGTQRGYFSAAGFILPNTLFFGSAADTNLYRSAPDALKTDDNFRAAGYLVIGDGSADQFLIGDVGGGGKIYFGSAGDTNLFRAGANHLKTDDALTVAMDFNVLNGFGIFARSNDVGGRVWLAGRISTDSVDRYAVDATGKTWWGPGGAGALDTNLYRYSADRLATDDAFWVVGSEIRSFVGGTGQITLDGAGGTPVIYFGSAFDTNLYRAAANLLATDDAFRLPVNQFSLQSSDGYVRQYFANADSTIWRAPGSFPFKWQRNSDGAELMALSSGGTLSLAINPLGIGDGGTGGRTGLDARNGLGVTAAIEVAGFGIKIFNLASGTRRFRVEGSVGVTFAGRRSVGDLVSYLNGGSISQPEDSFSATLSGNTLTSNYNGRLLVNGVEALVGDEVWIDFSTASGQSKAKNGLWVVTNRGTATVLGDATNTAWIMQRRSDADTAEELSMGRGVTVRDGIYAGRTFYIAATPATINVSDIVIEEFKASSRPDVNGGGACQASSAGSGVYKQFGAAFSLSAGEVISQASLSAVHTGTGGLYGFTIRLKDSSGVVMSTKVASYRFDNPPVGTSGRATLPSVKMPTFFNPTTQNFTVEVAPNDANGSFVVTDDFCNVFST